MKQVKCLKNKDVSVISTWAEYTGAFINIIPATTVNRNQLFLLLSTLFISINHLFLQFEMIKYSKINYQYTFSHVFTLYSFLWLISWKSKLAVILFCIKKKSYLMVMWVHHFVAAQWHIFQALNLVLWVTLCKTVSPVLPYISGIRYTGIL